MSVTASPPPAGTGAAAAGPRSVRVVFVGLMLGMLVASMSQTIVSPAMPRIVAELGGIEFYSWIATAAMLVSAVTVPIVGKLSDLYGRRPFYIAGLVIFLLGSVLAGSAQSFWWLVAARAVQGLGMGAIMPLSQTIIGDLIPPRQRGKYQGYMGAVFGISSIAGPLAGGWITDHWGWRWLFFVNLPLGVAALTFIVRNLHLPARPVSPHRIDVAGFVTLAGALVALLLPTTWGGTTYPWGSPQIIGLYAVGAVLLVAFILIELRADEPVLPLRLFRNSVFTFANIASLTVAMAMFGAIFYVPVYAQGVLGVDATRSGAILIPMSVAMIGTSIVIGLLITKTGHYKEFVLTGVLIMGVGFWLLTRLGYGSSQLQLVVATAVVGLGLGAAMQTYTLVVQNAVQRRDLGVATAATQFFRSTGATVGIAVLGTVMASRLAAAIPERLPAGADGGAAADVDAGAVLDPATLAQLPPEIAVAVRQALADALHDVFLTALPFVGVAFLATVFIRALPLRTTLHDATDAGQQVLGDLNQSSAEGVHEPIGSVGAHQRARERVLGLSLELLREQAARADRPLLRQAVTDLGDGDLDSGRHRLGDTAALLITDDPEVAGRLEECAGEVVERGRRPDGVLEPELRQRIVDLVAELSASADGHAAPAAGTQTALDVGALEAVATALSATLLADVSSARAADR